MPNSFERPSKQSPPGAENAESREKPGEYLYHMVPPNQAGNELIPLNELKEKFPETYEIAAKKYEGREHVQHWDIPTLDAKWNDALHLTPVHPADIVQALNDAGAQLHTSEWYKIPKSAIQANNAVVYKGQSPSGKVEEGEIQPFDEKNLAHFATLPEETVDYYREQIENGEKPLLFLGVPHVLYKGNIDTSKLETITV